MQRNDDCVIKMICFLWEFESSRTRRSAALQPVSQTNNQTTVARFSSQPVTAVTPTVNLYLLLYLTVMWGFLTFVHTIWQEAEMFGIHTVKRLGLQLHTAKFSFSSCSADSLLSDLSAINVFFFPFSLHFDLFWAKKRYSRAETHIETDQTLHRDGDQIPFSLSGF